MVTGDKTETAINVGYSSSLLDQTMRVFEIKGQTIAEVTELLTEAERSEAFR